MESYEDELLTRGERLRAQRQAQHNAPARIGVRLPAILLVVLGVLCWLGVSWLARDNPEAQDLPEPPELAEDPHEPRPLEQPPGSDGVSEAAETLESETVTVHIAGAVRDPQVVELDAGARVVDAVDAAGGLGDEAAAHGINLAAPVADGGLIYVPTADELEATEHHLGHTDLPQTGSPAAVAEAGVEAPALININTADSATLEQLPGIGPALAGRIITYRESHGDFNSLEELAAVSGIGPAILGNIGELVTW